MKKHIVAFLIFFLVIATTLSFVHVYADPNNGNMGEMENPMEIDNGNMPADVPYATQALPIGQGIIAKYKLKGKKLPPELRERLERLEKLQKIRLERLKKLKKLRVAKFRTIREHEDEYMLALMKEKYKLYREELKLLRLNPRVLNLTSEERLNLTKEFLLSLIDMRKSRLERVKKILEERNQTPGITSAIQVIDKHITYLDTLRQEVIAAKNMTELRKVTYKVKRALEREREVEHSKEKAAMLGFAKAIIKLHKLQRIIEPKIMATNDTQLISLFEDSKHELKLSEEFFNKSVRSLRNRSQYRQYLRQALYHLKLSYKYFITLRRQYHKKYDMPLLLHEEVISYYKEHQEEEEEHLILNVSTALTSYNQEHYEDETEANNSDNVVNESMNESNGDHYNETNETHINESSDSSDGTELTEGSENE